jgi:hypothetical protein
MSKKFQPHGSAGGEFFKKGVWYRAQRHNGVIISLKGRRGPFESPYFDICIPGDKKSEEASETKIINWLRCEIAKQPNEWRQYVIPSGTYAGKTLSFVYATDVPYLIRLGEKSNAPTEVLQALEHTANFDPWSQI